MTDPGSPGVQADPFDERQRWPNGTLTLAGVLVGAVAGLLIDFVPVGIAGGLALGVGLDSLLNHLVNERRER